MKLCQSQRRESRKPSFSAHNQSATRVTIRAPFHAASLLAAWWPPILALIFLVLARSGFCNPIETVDLSGTWGFTPLSGTATTIQVPGGGWYKQGFTNISQADYTKTITVPNTGQPQITRLEFGAVNNEADLYISGTLVGTSVQSFTPAIFDITKYVVPGNSYSIRVHVDGPGAFVETSGSYSGYYLIPNPAPWSTNLAQGIFRSAQLVVYPTVYISDVFVQPSVQNTNLYYNVWLTNESGTTASVFVSGSLNSWNGSNWSYPQIPSRTVALASGTTKEVTFGPVSWNLGASSYWWPNVPYQQGYTAQLHYLNLAIASGSGAPMIDGTSVRFGFRQCTVASDGTNTNYYLNGIRVNFRGDSLQGADYDSIVYDGGHGDAYDTLPGFLSGTNGWAQAVDNYQHLNYNFVRLHQEPVTPYMLDVMDEMGMMAMEETAIRGSNNDEDYINGSANMINHLMALYSRDRNHPCIVRESQSNEPNDDKTDSTQFETNLYNAAMSVDGTRPLSIDSYGGNAFYNSLTFPGFSVFGHYGNGIGQYTDQVWPRTDRPFGEGEFIWNADKTAQGFCWFGTSVQSMRSQGASDARPYTLLSAWAGFVPGVETTQMTLEQGGNPLYGADNLPSPWTNPIIQRVQAGFNPVLVSDTNYWSSNKVSDAAGDWPANVPAIQPGQSITRNLLVYNDTFSGTAVNVFWEFHQSSPTGPLVASGSINATVPLGYTTPESITFNTPNVHDGIPFYLVLYTEKNGVQMFRENSEQFMMLNQTQLSGSAFGTSPPYAAGSEYYRATDGNLSTFFDYSQASGGYTGLDLGAGNAQRISAIVYTPRVGFESRMVGGQFLASTDGTNYTTIYTVPSTPSPLTTVFVNTYTPYRFIEYAGPTGSYCDIAEMTFYTMNQTVLTGSAFGASPPFAVGSEYYRATDGNPSTFYDYSQPSGGYTGINLGSGKAQKVSSISFIPRSGLASRMLGGQFLASNDGVNYTPLYTVTTTPSTSSTSVFVDTDIPYQYLEYVGPSGGYCDIADMTFALSNTPIGSPVAPTGLSATAGTGQVSLSWNGVVGADFYNIMRTQTSGTDYVVVATATNASTYTDTSVTNGTTYYYVVSAGNTGGQGGNSSQVLAEPNTPFGTWQTLWFTAAQLANTAISGPTATPARDGISNLMKYALNLNPMAAAAPGQMPASSAVVVNGLRYATFTYRQTIAATDITYTPEISTDLVNWHSGSSYLSTTSVTDNSDGVTQTVVVQSANPITSGSPAFLRLQITLP